jgi:carboxymethylenebutenolidase
MTVVRERLVVSSPEGPIGCTTHHPAGAGPWPAVLFFMDALLVRPALLAMADRLAEAGYFVLFPNLLYRAGEVAPFDPKSVWTDENERARLMKLIGAAVQPESAMRDVGLYLAALEQQPQAKRGGVGMVGYCMGGMLSFRAAAAYPDRIAAVACIHGGNLVTDKPDSPHLGSERVKARLYFACADNDRSCTPEQREALNLCLKAAGARAEFEFYKGKLHGFAVTDTPVYDAEASEQHWKRVLALFRQAL